MTQRTPISMSESATPAAKAARSKRGACSVRPLSRLARWQQFTNTSSGTVRMERISLGPRKVWSESTTPPVRRSTPFASRSSGSPWPATCTMR